LPRSSRDVLLDQEDALAEAGFRYVGLQPVLGVRVVSLVKPLRVEEDPDAFWSRRPQACDYCAPAVREGVEQRHMQLNRAGCPRQSKGRILGMRIRRALAVSSTASILLLMLAPVSSVSGTVAQCFGEPATIVGTPEADRIRGTDHADVIVGLGGRDVIVGRKGLDLICGNDGPDRLDAGRAGDKLSGGLGSDDIYDGRGDDISLAGPGRDQLTSIVQASPCDVFCRTYDRWNDRVAGGPGTDRLFIDGGYANLSTGVYVTDASNDRIAGIEDVSGGFLNETIIGNARDNMLDAYLGEEDIVRGRAGDDIIGISGSDFEQSENGRMYGGPGDDWLDFEHDAQVDLREGTASSSGGELVLAGFENVRASANSLLAGDSGPNTLIGEFGVDTLIGRAGRDVLISHLRDDSLDGGRGTDRLNGGKGTDSCHHGEVVSNCE